MDIRKLVEEEMKKAMNEVGFSDLFNQPTAGSIKTTYSTKDLELVRKWKDKLPKEFTKMKNDEEAFRLARSLENDPETAKNLISRATSTTPKSVVPSAPAQPVTAPSAYIPSSVTSPSSTTAPAQPAQPAEPAQPAVKPKPSINPQEKRKQIALAQRIENLIAKDIFGNTDIQTVKRVGNIQQYVNILRKAYPNSFPKKVGNLTTRLAAISKWINDNPVQTFDALNRSGVIKREKEFVSVPTPREGPVSISRQSPPAPMEPFQESKLIRKMIIQEVRKALRK